MRGLSALTGKLNDQARGLEQKALEARDEAARAAMEQAKTYAPVKTGALRDSIQAEDGRVYTNCPYAGAVEFGGVHTSPQPFLSRAADGAKYAQMAQQKAREAIG